MQDLVQVTHTSEETKAVTIVETEIDRVAPNIPEQYVPRQSWDPSALKVVPSCVHELFHRRVLEQPQAPAVEGPDGSWSYSELDHQSSVLARKLHSQGLVGLEKFVPLIFEKSRWTVVAILAVIKAGGAFVLLDPSQPTQRLKTICTDTKAEVILSSPRQAALARLLLEHVVLVQPEDPENDTSIDWSSPSSKPDQALYAVFTSGSTGQPKGAVMEHGAFCTSALATGQRLGIHRESRVLQFAAYSFDVAIADHLMTLLLGGAVCILSETDRKEDLAVAAARMGVTWAFLTLSVARLVKPTAVPSLKTLAMGGEALTEEVIQMWSPHVDVFNLYGPAECAVGVTVNPSMESTHRTDIGYPSCAIAWVVNPDDPQQLQPVGEAGELVIQGPLVARGYLGNAATRAGSFFLQPTIWVKKHGTAAMGRLYRTGDIVRYDASTRRLLFQGRRDSQVKIHGQRVELGEVEHQLSRFFPAPQHVVADVISASLVAFVFPSGDMKNVSSDAVKNNDDDLFLSPTAADREHARQARSALQKTLPSYMVPSDILFLSWIPATATGKTDRRYINTQSSCLTAEQRRQFSTVLDQTRALPSTPVELALQRIWASVLQRAPDQIGVQDNFFSLGGTSLDAIRLASLVRREELGHAQQQASLSLIFDHPTIESMTQALYMAPVCNVSKESFRLDSSFMEDILRQGSLQRSDLQEGPSGAGLVHGITDFQRNSLLGHPMHLVVEIPASVDHSRLETAWSSVMARNAALRSVFFAAEGLPTYQAFRRFLGSEIIPITQPDNQEPVDQFVGSFCSQDAARKIPDGQLHCNLTRIAHENGKTDQLVLRLNHALYDALSLPILVNDLTAAYHGNPLPAKQVDFPNYMHRRWQRNQAATAVRFWQKFLAGARMTSVECNPATTPATETYLLAMQQTPAFTPPVGITLATVFRAAWATVLAQHTGVDDVVFGETVDGRGFPLEELDGIFGCAIGSSPMRIILPRRDSSKGEFLRYAQDQHTRRIPHETMDMDAIVAPNCAPHIDAKFGSVLVVENPNAVPEIVLDGKPCPSRWVFHGPLSDLYIQLCPGPETLNWAICVPPKWSFTQKRVDSLLDSLVKVVAKFAVSPEEPLSTLFL